MFRRELIIYKNQKIQNNQRDICKQTNKQTNKKKTRKVKEKREVKMDAIRRSVNRNDTKKPFVTNATGNHKSETHVTGVYTLMLPHAMTSCAAIQCLYLESQ